MGNYTSAAAQVVVRPDCSIMLTFKPLNHSNPLYMTATLYSPQQLPQAVYLDGLSLPSSTTEFVWVPEQISNLLGCAPDLVDVLASGSGYVVYSVFDSEGETNHAAMAAVAEVSGVTFEAVDEDAILRGPILVVQCD